MAHYIIQITAFQVFFLLIYDVFLKKETFFNWNRFYLMVTVILSIILPFIKIESFENSKVEEIDLKQSEIPVGCLGAIPSDEDFIREASLLSPQ